MSDIQLVQNLIERCLQLYMPQKQVVETLQKQAKVGGLGKPCAHARAGVNAWSVAASEESLEQGANGVRHVGLQAAQRLKRSSVQHVWFPQCRFVPVVPAG